jgi:acyl dehydratase
MEMQAIYFEDFVLGEEHETYARTVTEADIVMHAGLGDFFPHHMDAEFCKTTEFGRRIAHGTLILSMAMGMKATKINKIGRAHV